LHENPSSSLVLPTAGVDASTSSSERMHLCASDVAALMLVSHHPVITSGFRRHKGSAWQAVCRAVPSVVNSLPGESQG
jgi:hypothetical protein